MSADLPPDLLRGLTTSRVSRRRMLQLGGLAALGGALSACSIPGTTGSKLGLQAAREEIAKFWAAQKQQGHLNFANWPLYMDEAADDPNVHPSLDLFTKQTGISVTYDAIINADDTYYGKIAPQLKTGQGTGYDLMVITNGVYLDALVQRDFIVPLDQSRMKNFYQYSSDLVKDPSYDRGNVYTMAWQSGITGIGYDPERVGHEITSWEDLQDPALSGKIGMFADNQDLPNAALCAVGVNPENSTPDDWHKAADWLKKQRPLVRKYYDQGYANALVRGDLYATMAWSGDVFAKQQQGHPNLQFVVPEEGAPLWTDNMCIPAHAEHSLDAMIYMDWVYQPKIAALLADYIWYITPVSGVQAIFEKDAADATSKGDKTYYTTLATSPLIFPKASDYARLHRYRVLTVDEQEVWNDLFEPIYQS